MNEEVLTEMPKTIPKLKWHDLFNRGLNFNRYQMVENDQTKKVYLKVNDHAVIYQVDDKFIGLDADKEQITYFMRYEVDRNDILGDYVWQSLVWRSKTANYLTGIPKKIFFEFMLPKFSCIVTDSDQTWDGERFWGARIADAIEMNLHVYYFNFETEELIEVKTIREFEKIQETHDIWGPSDAHRMKRMVISGRELIKN
jgi:hypothetical protein